MHPGIYAVLDTKADDFIGPLQVHKHEAAAVRFFADVATIPDSFIGKHPEDFELVRLGYLDDSHNVVANYKTIITGEQWAATQNRQDDLHTGQ